MNQGLLAQALIYFAAAVIAVPLFKRLGLGSVLGYLCAGLIIGPWGLKLVADPEAILHFAEFGVVLLLFLVGLELNPERVWSLRVPILGMGTAQVAATVLVVTAIGLLLGVDWRFALVAGMGFAMSSTAIALQTLEEKNLLGTPGGQSGFSVLLFQDLAVIPLMLALALMAPAKQGMSMDWMAVVKAVGMIALIIVAGRFLIRPVLRYIATTGIREIFIAFALLLVFGVALLAQAVGLSMALGTFLAGVLLADSEYRHELELDIEPFKGLLLGLFFVAVGMSVDLRLFIDSPARVLGITVAIVAVKILLLLTLARGFKLCGQDGWLFALALSQVGEFAFVLFGVALSEGVIGRAQADLLNAATAASMLTTPFLMITFERVIVPRFNRQTERAPDVIDEQNPVIIAGFGRFGQVVTRLLVARGFKVTVIEHDPNQIELVRKFGWKAYYGDVTRLDLLHSAGADKAKLIVLAIDDNEAVVETTKLIQSHFPTLTILARARSRVDAFELVELGVHFEREVFRAALALAERALTELGVPAHAAHRAARQFREHDEALIRQVAPHRHDQKRLISEAAKARTDLEQLLSSEQPVASEESKKAWQ